MDVLLNQAVSDSSNTDGHPIDLSGFAHTEQNARARQDGIGPLWADWHQ